MLCFFFVILLQLGANAILAVSLAVCKAGAEVKNIPLYKVHSGSLDFIFSFFFPLCRLMWVFEYCSVNGRMISVMASKSPYLVWVIYFVENYLCSCHLNLINPSFGCSTLLTLLVTRSWFFQSLLSMSSMVVHMQETILLCRYGSQYSFWFC